MDLSTSTSMLMAKDEVKRGDPKAVWTRESTCSSPPGPEYDNDYPRYVEERPDRKKDKKNRKWPYGRDAPQTNNVNNVVSESQPKTEKDYSQKKAWQPKKKGRTSSNRGGNTHNRAKQQYADILDSLRDSQSKFRGDQDANRELAEEKEPPNGKPTPGPINVPSLSPKSNPDFGCYFHSKWIVHDKLPIGYSVLVAAVTYKIGPQVVNGVSRVMMSLPTAFQLAPIRMLSAAINLVSRSFLSSWLVGATLSIGSYMVARNYIKLTHVYEADSAVPFKESADGRADVDGNSVVRHADPVLRYVFFRPSKWVFWQRDVKLLVSLEMVCQLLAPQVFDLDDNLDVTRTRAKNTTRTLQTINYPREVSVKPTFDNDPEHIKQHSQALALAIMQEEKYRLQDLPFQNPQETAWDGLLSDIGALTGFFRPIASQIKSPSQFTGISGSWKVGKQLQFPWGATLLGLLCLIPITMILTQWSTVSSSVWRWYVNLTQYSLDSFQSSVKSSSDGTLILWQQIAICRSNLGLLIDLIQIGVRQNYEQFILSLPSGMSKRN